MEHGDLTGAILDGRYRVLEPVAQGAMGTVYRAERVKLGRIVAVKVLHDVLPAELSARKRFEIEAMAMARLEHPHCASVLDIGVHDDRPYVVMDFVSGPNLKELIATGPQPAPRAVEIVRQVLTGLAHAHELGIIHRDIKPANLVLSQKTGLGDHVKILDFGLARVNDAAQSLTSGIVVGTPAYMAPEQIRGHSLDPRADLYACGVLLFELLTGEKPFHSEKDDPIEVCRMHLHAPVPRLDDKLDASFGELEGVVAKALSKDRDGRYASAQEFAATLEAASARRPSRPSAPPVPPPGPIELGSGDMLIAPDASYPPAVEVRSTDVLSETVDSAVAGDPRTGTTTPLGMPVAPAGARTPPTGSRTTAPPRGSATPSGGAPSAGSRAADARTATPLAGSRTPAPPPGSGPPAAGSRIADGHAATPPAGSRTAASPSSSTGASAGGRAADARTAGAGTDASSSDEISAPGTFLGKPVRASAKIPRLTSESGRARSADERSQDREGAGAKDSGARARDRAARDADRDPRDPAAQGGPRDRAASHPEARNRTVPRRSRWRAAAIVAAVLIAAGATVGLVVSRDSGDAASTGAGSAGSSVADPARDLAARANELAEKGERDAAIELLHRARKQYPDHALLAYTAGRICFSKYYWTEGLRNFRDAIRLEPAYRSDPELIKTVLRGFNTTPGYNDDLAGFLRDEIGSAVQPLLEETARDHPNPIIRNRAAAELRRYH